MGDYLIPNARSSIEAAMFLVPQPGGWVLTVVPGGVTVHADDATDAEIAARFVGYAPSGITDEQLREALPSYLAPHVQHLRDYRAAVRAGQTPTQAQTAHAVADLIDAVRYLNNRITAD